MLVDWADAWIKRGVKEPDGYPGWPKADGASTSVMPGLYTDNMLGEAMGLRPVVLMADTILKTPALEAEARAEGGRANPPGRTGLRQVGPAGLLARGEGRRALGRSPFGIDRRTGQWTDGYARRNTDGFSLPANKQNFIALWLLAMHEVTKKARYRQRAEKWWRLMKSRMRLRGRRQVLRLELLGPGRAVGLQARRLAETLGRRASQRRLLCDRRGGHRDRLRAWPGVPQGRPGAADRHQPRFHVEPAGSRGAKFQRIDGGKPDPRWKDSPGVLWTALVPTTRPCGRCSRRTTSRTVGAAWRRRRGISLRGRGNRRRRRDAGRPLVVSLPYDDNGNVRF